MATICITGGTGLIGNALAQYLSAKGHAIIILTRNKDAVQSGNVSYAFWDVKKEH